MLSNSAHLFVLWIPELNLHENWQVPKRKTNKICSSIWFLTNVELKAKKRKAIKIGIFRSKQTTKCNYRRHNDGSIGRHGYQKTHRGRLAAKIHGRASANTKDQPTCHKMRTGHQPPEIDGHINNKTFIYIWGGYATAFRSCVSLLPHFLLVRNRRFFFLSFAIYFLFYFFLNDEQKKNKKKFKNCFIFEWIDRPDWPRVSFDYYERWGIGNKVSNKKKKSRAAFSRISSKIKRKFLGVKKKRLAKCFTTSRQSAW